MLSTKRRISTPYLLIIIIIIINIAASSDVDSSKYCETRGKCIFFTILERRVKERKKEEWKKERIEERRVKKGKKCLAQ